MRAKLILCLLVGVASLSSCSTKETVKPTENAITTFVSSDNSITTGTRTSGPWELGVVFSSSVVGKLTQVGSKMPEPGSYRIIVWDFDTKQVLRQKTVEQTTPDNLTLNDIESLTLIPNKKYVISVNSQSSGANKKYAFAAKSGTSEFMPFTKGSILVYNSCYRNTATPLFPDGIKDIKTELYGFPEFTFIPD